jgi:hypothetical protein
MRRMLAVLTTLVTVAALSPAAAQALPDDDRRQHAFAAAAEEFGVPQNVLLAVSYLQSRWNYNSGTPSTAAGYGPMHLTDLDTAGTGSHHDAGEEDPRGDAARPPLHPVPPRTQPRSPELHTLDLAAQLTGIPQEELRRDPAQNIRGGAALLAHYQRQLGHHGNGAAHWYGAVARYGGTTDSAAAAAFADEVYAVIAGGLSRVTDDGQAVRLAPAPGIVPERRQLRALDLRRTDTANVECPDDVSCEWLPAPYEELPGGGYGNHDKADRPRDQEIDYIVIHDTEGYWDGVLDLVQDPAYVSWHYTLRSSDGHIAQHVRTEDVAWHAGNWYVNAKSIGLEHEGFAAHGTWYTEAMYRTSAKLVRHLADRYDIPLDRQHILGHDNVAGTTPETVAGMHWDPGPYWDWSHYFDLLGAPLDQQTAAARSTLVTISPDFESNRPAFVGCGDAAPDRPCPSRGSSSVVLHTEPRADAPLLTDIGLHPDGSPSTMHVSDIGSRVGAGQQYAVADTRGDWTAIWYLGQKGWFHDPETAPVARPTRGYVVTPKPGRESVPVYGRAYPEPDAYPERIEPQEIVPLQYELPAGQYYAAGPRVRAEYFSATTFAPQSHTVVRGETRYVQIQFGHRVAYVKADDVRVRPANLRP